MYKTVCFMNLLDSYTLFICREYLTGFRKRKEERKNKAKLEIERKLKTQINQERNKVK